MIAVLAALGSGSAFSHLLAKTGGRRFSMWITFRLDGRMHQGERESTHFPGGTWN